MFKFPRTEERFRPRLEEPIYVDLVGDGFYDRCRIRDISANGLSVHVRHDFDGINLNQEIDLHITLPSKVLIKAIGQIRHRGLGKDHYFGIYIIGLDSGARRILDEYLETLSSQSLYGKKVV